MRNKGISDSAVLSSFIRMGSEKEAFICMGSEKETLNNNTELTINEFLS
jgi:hypothetical protein